MLILNIFRKVGLGKFIIIYTIWLFSKLLMILQTY